MKSKLTSAMIFLCLMAFFTTTSGQNSFYEFKSSYEPSDRLFSPDNEIVYQVKNQDIAAASEQMQLYIKSNDLASFALIILSLDRNKAGKILDNMPSKYAVKGMQFLADKWALEVMYYVSERTYNEIADKINATRHFGILSMK